jgi:hypothetical protein
MLTNSFPVLDVAKNMDKAYADIEKELDEKLSSFGFRSDFANQTSVPHWLKNQDKRLPGVPMMELRNDSWFLKKNQPHKTESIY